jgi:peptidyl-prolyl cis-trans isomerase SurA
MKHTLIVLIALAFSCGVPLALRAQDVPPPKGLVLDRIIAHVNDAIITSNQYEQAEKSLREEIKHDCPSCNAAELETRFQKQSKNILRNLIDQDLLVQRAKDEGINVDAQVILQLNQMREKYGLRTMGDLRRAAEASGINWSDLKDSIKRQLLVQKLIEQDVGGTIQIDHQEVEKYYQTHKSEFDLPEEVYLREIFLSTKGKTPAQIAQIRKKLEGIRQKVLNGDSFGQLAKLYSQGPTAQENGELGMFTRGKLAPAIDNAVFKLQHNEMTPIMDLGNGLAIFQVQKHYQAGIQPMDKVEPQIEQAIYQKKIGPALRQYLAELRKRSYILVKPGYVDSAAVTSEAPFIKEEPDSGSQSGHKGKDKKKRKGL